MGRGHLARLAAGGVALVLAAAASAAIHWQVLAHGIARGRGPSNPAAYIALNLTATNGFAALLPADARMALTRNDFTRQAVVAVFGDFGCTDHRIAVTGVVQRAQTLVVSLLMHPIAPGTVECMAIYPTYRLLTVAKAQLTRPFPTRAEARLARA